MCSGGYGGDEQRSTTDIEVKVVITDMSAENLCEVYIGSDCTVAELKHEIERITRAPVYEQVLTCAEVVLNNESVSMRQLESAHGAPLVVMLIVPKLDRR